MKNMLGKKLPFVIENLRLGYASAPPNPTILTPPSSCILSKNTPEYLAFPPRMVEDLYRVRCYMLVG